MRRTNIYQHNMITQLPHNAENSNIRQTFNNPSHFLGIKSRSSSSSGLWLSMLLPLACCPGFYEIHSYCKPPPKILSIYALQVGLSSLSILYEFYCKQVKHKENGEKTSSRNKIVQVITHPYMPPTLSIILLYVLTNIDNPVDIVGAFACCALQLRVTEWILTVFGDSFSIGEGILVSQAASLTLSLCVKSICSISEIKSENKQLFSFVQVAILTASSLGYIIWKWKGKWNFIKFVFIICGMGSIGIGISSFMLKEWSPVWLFHIFISPTRMALVGWWLNISVIIILTAVASQRFAHLPQTVLRKVFHILMVLIIVPGIVLDPSLTYFASTGAMILFLLLEVIRVAEVEPVCSVLNSMFHSFLDEKDSGSLVLSHIYLLAGLSLPLWLYPCDFLHTERPPNLPNTEPDTGNIQFCVLPLLAGVLSVGIGDTAASIGGTYLGKHKLPGSNKTIEGCLCSIITQTGFVCGVVHISSINLWWNSWPRLLVSIVLNAVIEAFTDQVDNIVLPLLMYTPLMDP